jgi:hypothetical protein
MDEFWSFDDALRCTDEMKRTLLVGSGFSAALDRRYLYTSLYEQADVLTPALKMIFQELETKDFEEVIRAIRHANVICDVYQKNVAFDPEIQTVKCALLQAISKVHHSHQAEISETKARQCYVFLKNFTEVFTLNYDLLPYWVLMRNSHENTFKDGFGYASGEGRDFLRSSVHEANFHYLHGALHLYERDGFTYKLNFKAQNDRKYYLIEQIKSNLSENRFPLFVSEGRPADKVKHIQSNSYLSEALQKLKTTGQAQKTALFTYGVSFNISDRHILEALSQSGCHSFFIGVYGRNATSQLNYNVTKVLNSSFNVKFYDTSKFSPWHGTAESYHDPCHAPEFLKDLRP